MKNYSHYELKLEHSYEDCLQLLEEYEACH